MRPGQLRTERKRRKWREIKRALKSLVNSPLQRGDEGLFEIRGVLVKLERVK